MFNLKGELNQAAFLPLADRDTFVSVNNSRHRSRRWRKKSENVHREFGLAPSPEN